MNRGRIGRQARTVHDLHRYRLCGVINRFEAIRRLENWLSLWIYYGFRSQYLIVECPLVISLEATLGNPPMSPLLKITSYCPLESIPAWKSELAVAEWYLESGPISPRHVTILWLGKRTDWNLGVERTIVSAPLAMLARFNPNKMMLWGLWRLGCFVVVQMLRAQNPILSTSTMTIAPRDVLSNEH